MKNVLTLLAIMLLPLSVWAMTPIADTDLSDVTGQAGVNINANVTMDINIGTMAWGDSDGLKSVYNPWDTAGSTTKGGYVGVTGFDITNLTIQARTETTDNYNHYNTLMLKPITIDVATANADITSEAMLAGTTFVRIGLGSLEISMDALSFDVALAARTNTTDATNALGTSGLTQTLGTVSMGGMAVYINPWSYVDIFSASGSSVGDGSNKIGVCFAVNVTIDKFKMDYISWGDKDGLTAGSRIAGTSYWMTPGTHESAGYIGLSNVNIGDPTHPAITMNGTVAIDVTTSFGGASSASASGVYTYLYSVLTAINNAGSSVLNIRDKANLLDFYQFVIDNGYHLDNGFEVATCAHFYILTHGGGNIPVSYVARPLTIVHISFPTDFNLDVSKITADVALSDHADFTGNTQVLGDLYLQGLDFRVKTGSWVDIWAH